MPFVAPLNVSVRHRRTGYSECSAPPRLTGRQLFVVSCRAPNHRVRCTTQLQARPVWRGGVLSDALSNKPMQRSAGRAVHVVIGVPLPRPLIGSVRHRRTGSWQCLDAAALDRPSLHRSELPRLQAASTIRHEPGRRGSRARRRAQGRAV
jgi:hypothetical protein